MNHVAPLSEQFAVPGKESFQYYLVDLHDIVKDPQTRENLLPGLEGLIRAQAGFHRVPYSGDLESLEKNIWKKGNTFRGFLVYTKEATDTASTDTEQNMPIAYAVYYPMIDSKGRRAAYCEDAYVSEGFRDTNLFNIVLSEMGKRITEEGCEYLQWSTDKRNHRFKLISQKIGATQPSTVTLVADDLLKMTSLQENMLKNGWAQGNLKTRLIQASDINLLKGLNIDQNLIRMNGDMDFKGFITFDNRNLRKPIAITPGWEHFSTFKVTPGLYLESPTFDESVDDRQKLQILLSVSQEAQKYASQKDKKLGYLRWHVDSNDNDLMNILKDELSLPIDCMQGPGKLDSQMIVHVLSNGSLQAMCDFMPTNDQILHVPADSIGPAPRHG